MLVSWVGSIGLHGALFTALLESAKCFKLDLKPAIQVRWTQSNWAMSKGWCISPSTDQNTVFTSRASISISWFGSWRKGLACGFGGG